MRVGIVFAMKSEQDAFLSYFPNVSLQALPYGEGFIFEAGKHTIVGLLAGVGKVNAAMHTTRLFENESIDVLFNVGVAGGIHLNPGQLIVAQKVLYHDVDVRSFGYPLGMLPGQSGPFNCSHLWNQRLQAAANRQSLDWVEGILGSGDQFVTSLDDLNLMLAEYPNLKAIDMEAAAIAHVAQSYRCEFVAIRTISDRIGEVSQIADFNRFVYESALKAGSLMVEVLTAHDA